MGKRWLIFTNLACMALNANVDLTICYENPFNTNDRSADLIVTTHLGAGFFCELTKIIGSLIYYESDGLARVRVDWTHEFFPYKDEPHGNGWDLYFEPIVVEFQEHNEKPQVVGPGGLHELHDQICSSPWLSYDQFLPYRNFVHQKINQYIRIKKNVTDKVDAFYNKNMHNCLRIGVHVRFANAHAHEVPGGRHPTIEEYFREIDAIIKSNSYKNIKIYIASDSHHVIARFKQRYPSNLVYIDAYRASGSEDPGLIYENQNYWLSHPAEWHKKKAGFNGGLTALMDCLLLAKCDYLVHTTSNLSNFVGFFNPTIKSIYLPRSAPYIACRYKGNPGIRNKFLNPV